MAAEIRRNYADVLSGFSGADERLMIAASPLIDIILKQRSKGRQDRFLRFNDLASACKEALAEGVSWLAKPSKNRPVVGRVKAFLNRCISNAIPNEEAEQSKPMGFGPDAKTILKEQANAKKILDKSRKGKSRLCTCCEQEHWTDSEWTVIKRGKTTIAYACKAAFDAGLHNALLTPSNRRFVQSENMDWNPTLGDNQAESKASELLEDVLSVCVNERERALVGVAASYPDLERGELAKLIGKSTRTVQQDLKRLHDRKCLWDEALSVVNL